MKTDPMLAEAGMMTWRKTPFIRCKARKRKSCMRCHGDILPGDGAFRPLRENAASMILRCDRLCQKCGDAVS